MITQTLDLNLIPGRVLPMVNVSQYDKDSRTLEFTIYNGDQSFDLTGLSAYIQGLKPDGNGFNYSANISTGKITADITEQMTAISGRVMCEVIIMSGTDRIGTGNFILNVEAAAMPDNANMSDSEYSYIQELIEEAQEVVDEAEGYVEDAEAWARGTKNGSAVPATDPTYQNNSKYYAEQAQQYAQGALHYKGSVLFANIPITGMAEGDMYNIEDDFVTDNRFQEGVGIHVAAGSNIAWNANSKWDVLAPMVSDMTGATALTPGTHGLVPSPAAGDEDKYLKGDGTWGSVSAGADFVGATAGSSGTHGLVPAPAAGDQDKFLKGNGTWDKVPEAGHTIQNASGTNLTQRDTLQFKGGLKATDDNVNQKTVVDGSPSEITWAQYNALSPAQQSALEHTVVTDVPGADGTISADLMTKLWENQSPTSAFSSQDISLSSSDYDFLMVFFSVSYNNSRCSSCIIAKGQTGRLSTSNVTNNGAESRIRDCIRVSDTVYTFADAYTATGTQAISTSNILLIPLSVYGIKKTVTVKFDALARDVSTLASNCMLSDGVTSVGDALNGVDISTDFNDDSDHILVYAKQLGKFVFFSMEVKNVTLSANSAANFTLLNGTKQPVGEIALAVAPRNVSTNPAYALIGGNTLRIWSGPNAVSSGDYMITGSYIAES